MKTLITFVMLVLSTVCFAQEEENTIFTEEQTTQLKEVMETLSNKLTFMQEKEAFFSNEDLRSLKESLTQVQTKINKAQLKASLLEMKKRSDNSKITYSITYDDGKSSKGIAQLEDLDFQKLSRTLENVLAELQESPKLKELAESLIKVEEKLAKKE